MTNRLRLRRSKSQSGRIISKPERPSTTEERVDETPVPIQDQIEQLRTKIALKERYNTVIEEEVFETKLGAASCLQELFAETRELRTSLLDALQAEQTAVQHALRLYTDYQLAMTDKSASVAMPWLKDKVFDLTKKYLSKLFELTEKRKKVDEVEQMVVLIEKMPLPGSLSWEKELIKGFYQLENHIENAKAKGATAQTLHSTYMKIKYMLREESGKYYPIMKLYENQSRIQMSEFNSLKKMLRDANQFKESADRDLLLIEKEAAENRKLRRIQMARIRKIVDQAFFQSRQSEMVKNEKKDTGEGNYIKMQMDRSGLLSKDDKFHVVEELIGQRLSRIDEFHERIRQVLSIMRVQNVKMVPARYKTIQHLSEMLSREVEIKTSLRDTLFLQKSHLYLIQCNLNYSGDKEEELFTKKKNLLLNAKEEIQSKIIIKRKQLDEIGEISLAIRFSTISIFSLLNPQQRQIRPHEVPKIKALLKSLYSEMSQLKRRIQILRTMLGPSHSVWKFGKTPFYKAPPVPPYYIRVGSPVQTQSEGDETDDDEFIDSKIPGRIEIKSAGKRLMRQAIISKGLK